jgi:hypothetical protein
MAVEAIMGVSTTRVLTKALPKMTKSPYRETPGHRTIRIPDTQKPQGHNGARSLQQERYITGASREPFEENNCPTEVAYRGT